MSNAYNPYMTIEGNLMHEREQWRREFAGKLLLLTADINLRGQRSRDEDETQAMIESVVSTTDLLLEALDNLKASPPPQEALSGRFFISLWE